MITMRAQSILRAINVTKYLWLLVPAVQGRTSKLIVIRSMDAQRAELFTGSVT